MKNGPRNRFTLWNIIASIRHFDIESKEYRAVRPFNPSNPPTDLWLNASLPPALRTKYPVTARFDDHDVLDKALMFNPKWQLISIQAL
jgi:hypothetical protein